jgi:hypothetical protein
MKLCSNRIEICYNIRENLTFDVDADMRGRVRKLELDRVP